MTIKASTLRLSSDRPTTISSPIIGPSTQRVEVVDVQIHHQVEGQQEQQQGQQEQQEQQRPHLEERMRAFCLAEGRDKVETSSDGQRFYFHTSHGHYHHCYHLLHVGHEHEEEVAIWDAMEWRRRCMMQPSSCPRHPEEKTSDSEKEN